MRNGVAYHLPHAERCRGERVPLFAGNERDSGGLRHLHHGQVADNPILGGDGAPGRTRHGDTVELAMQTVHKRRDSPLAAVRKRIDLEFRSREHTLRAFCRSQPGLHGSEASLEGIYRERNPHLHLAFLNSA